MLEASKISSFFKHERRLISYASEEESQGGRKGLPLLHTEQMSPNSHPEALTYKMMAFGDRAVGKPRELDELMRVEPP